MVYGLEGEVDVTMANPGSTVQPFGSPIQTNDVPTWGI
jgi:hypothetical protein